MNTSTTSLDTLISLLKRRGFVYQGSEIYGGLAGTWDYGPMGVALKKNIENLWWKRFVTSREDVYGIDAAILMNEKVWEASGHTQGFADPLVECKKCHTQYRADQIGYSPENISPVCETCNANDWLTPHMFNMMFSTKVGAQGDTAATSYLRPETAQGMFVNFKNILDSFHPTLPFGMAQIGKAFRNEIAPRDFLFRTREFEQMEIEYFVHPSQWEDLFTYWHTQMRSWMKEIGLADSDIEEEEVSAADRAHYSKRTIDFNYRFPFGTKELYGLAYRTNHDLTMHIEKSGADLRYTDALTNEKFVPHVIEPTFGIGRTMLAVLCAAYDEEEVNGETRTVLRLPKQLAPIQIAVLPLSKKEELSVGSRSIFEFLSRTYVCQYDETQSIGKRYRRQDEIGTPFCITFDFESLTDNMVTVRERDSMKQERIAIDDLPEYFAKNLA
jgi:glycyl-tRNA synthetase